MTENKDSARSAERLRGKERHLRAWCCGLAVFAVGMVFSPIGRRILASHPDSRGWLVALLAAKAALLGLVAGGIVWAERWGRFWLAFVGVLSVAAAVAVALLATGKWL